MAQTRQDRRAPTMADVARLARVSQQTVSRVLNDYAFIRPETRERVREAIQRLDYRPNVAARTLVTRRSRTIGVVATDYHSHGPATALGAIETAARKAGYGVGIMSLQETSPRNIAKALKQLAGQGVDGIVMIAPQDVTASAAFVSFDNIPVVTFNSVDRGENMSIMLDSVEGSRLATRCLVELGHRRIAHIAGGREFSVTQSRIEGWRKALALADLPAPEPLQGDWSAASGYECGRRIVETGGFTAAHAANDLMALGLMLALNEAGLRVPEDFSVVGFDDIPEAAYFVPPLTTVRQDFAELGRRCVGAVLAQLDGEQPRRFEPLKPELVVRASTAAPPR